MGMLKSIELENYKCFKDKTTIDIAPLTVLCGVNSSGKSSILKSLLMLKQSYENNSSKGQLVFSGNFTDNGTFKDIVYYNSENSFRIKNSFVISNEFDGGNERQKFSADKSNYREISKIFKNIAEGLGTKPNKYIISVDMIISGNSNPKTQIQAIRNTISEYVIEIQLVDNEEVLHKSNVTIQRESSGLYTISFVKFPIISDNGYLSTNEITQEITNCHCYYDGIKIIKIYSDKPPREYDMNSFLPNLYTIFSIISTQYYNIKHISPLRYFPNRNYTITRAIRDMTPSGEDMLQILAQYGSNQIDFYFLNDDEKWEKEKNTLFYATQKWSSYFETGDLNLSQNEEMIKLNVSGHNLIDVGVGVGQSMPIVIEGLFAPKESTLIIEQPEIHLHPKAQMNMADFLISLSLAKKNVIVETHSDHIINRLVRRIMKDKTGSLINDIQIYFIDKNSDNPIEKISISPTKGIVNAPDDFFTQFASETMEIFKAGVENIKKKVGDEE